MTKQSKAALMNTQCRCQTSKKREDFSIVGHAEREFNSYHNISNESSAKPEFMRKAIEVSLGLAWKKWMSTIYIHKWSTIEGINMVFEWIYMIMDLTCHSFVMVVLCLVNIMMMLISRIYITAVPVACSRLQFSLLRRRICKARPKISLIENP